jgi:hypothetical protein
MKIALLLITGASLLFLSPLPPTAPAQAPSAGDQIATIAANSSCAQVNWKNRGLAPKAYMRGMALVFARAVCQADRADVLIVSAARATPGPETNKTDALTWYDAKFAALGMSNATDGVETLRHAYTLLIGLGMRESSGQFCVGRDRSADFTSADSAEAGLFQTSFGARTKHATMVALHEKYKANQNDCLLDTFKLGVACPAKDAENFGTGEGRQWQQLTKTCPAFATEYAAVLMRVHGGRKGEFGPLRNRAAELMPVCDAMLKQVQDLVRSNPQMCSAL